MKLEIWMVRPRSRRETFGSPRRRGVGESDTDSFEALGRGALCATLALSSRPVDLLADDADIAERIGTRGPSTLMTRSLGREAFLLRAAPSSLAAAGAPQPPEEFSRHRLLVMRTDGAAAQIEVTSGRAVRRIASTPALPGNEPAVVLQAALAGGGDRGGQPGDGGAADGGRSADRRSASPATARARGERAPCAG